MKLVFAPEAWEDYLHWQEHDPKVLARLNSLIRECQRSPFSGAGKPEALKGALQGWWSRRITHEDRLVYRIAGKDRGQALEIAQGRRHC